MKAIGIVLAGGNNRMMRELTNKRAIASMPVAGSYRAIDFALSNMSNSHIQKVAVITQYNARSLNELQLPYIFHQTCVYDTSYLNYLMPMEYGTQLCSFALS